VSTGLGTAGGVASYIDVGSGVGVGSGPGVGVGSRAGVGWIVGVGSGAGVLIRGRHVALGFLGGASRGGIAVALTTEKAARATRARETNLNMAIIRKRAEGGGE